jgi:hypothetical protein
MIKENVVSGNIKVSGLLSGSKTGDFEELRKREEGEEEKNNK